MFISMAQQQSVRVGFGEPPIWLWDLSIHSSDKLLQIVEMTDRVVTVIGLLYFWDVSGGEVETSSLVSMIQYEREYGIDETTNIHFLEFTLEMLRIG